MAADDRAAQWSRDLERCSDIALLDPGLGSCSNLANVIPTQFRNAAGRLVEKLARVQQSLLLGFGDAALAATFALGRDSDATRMERCATEELATDSGRISTLNLGDYQLPTAADVPPLVTVLVDGAEGPAPYGAKAVGEPA